MALPLQDKYALGDFADYCQGECPDEFGKISQVTMWPLVKKNIQHEDYTLEFAHVIKLGTYFYRQGGHKFVYAKATGYEVECFQGTERDDIIQPIGKLQDNRQYYTAPFVYISGSQEANGMTKQRTLGKEHVELMVQFVFLLHAHIIYVYNTDSKDLLSQFKAICINYEVNKKLIKEEDHEEREREKEKRFKNLGPNAPGYGLPRGGKKHKPDPKIKTEPDNDSPPKIKKEYGSDDEDPWEYYDRSIWDDAEDTGSGYQVSPFKSSSSLSDTPSKYSATSSDKQTTKTPGELRAARVDHYSKKYSETPTKSGSSQSNRKRSAPKSSWGMSDDEASPSKRIRTEVARSSPAPSAYGRMVERRRRLLGMNSDEED